MKNSKEQTVKCHKHNVCTIDEQMEVTLRFSRVLSSLRDDVDVSHILRYVADQLSLPGSKQTVSKAQHYDNQFPLHFVNKKNIVAYSSYI